MNSRRESGVGSRESGRRRRTGSALIVVLIVVVLLSLGAYTFLDSMLLERRASDFSARTQGGFFCFFGAAFSGGSAKYRSGGHK